MKTSVLTSQTIWLHFTFSYQKPRWWFSLKESNQFFKTFSRALPIGFTTLSREPGFTWLKPFKRGKMNQAASLTRISIKKGVFLSAGCGLCLHDLTKLLAYLLGSSSFLKRNSALQRWSDLPITKTGRSSETRVQTSKAEALAACRDYIFRCQYLNHSSGSIEVSRENQFLLIWTRYIEWFKWKYFIFLLFVKET